MREMGFDHDVVAPVEPVAQRVEVGDLAFAVGVDLGVEFFILEHPVEVDHLEIRDASSVVRCGIGIGQPRLEQLGRGRLPGPGCR